MCKIAGKSVAVFAPSNAAVDVFTMKVLANNKEFNHNVKPIRYATQSDEVDIVMAAYKGLHGITEVRGETGEPSTANHAASAWHVELAAEMQRTDAAWIGKRSSRHDWVEAALSSRALQTAGIVVDGGLLEEQPAPKPNDPYQPFIDAFYNPDYLDDITRKWAQCEAQQAEPEAQQPEPEAQQPDPEVQQPDPEAQ